MSLAEIDDTLLFGMASGSFIPRQTLEEVGLMREEFWIDYIDYEFSFRVRKRGLRILGVGGARLNHRLGIANYLKILGKVLSFQVHPPSEDILFTGIELQLSRSIPSFFRTFYGLKFYR